jgi:hypothetical protein
VASVNCYIIQPPHQLLPAKTPNKELTTNNKNHCQALTDFCLRIGAPEDMADGPPASLADLQWHLLDVAGNPDTKLDARLFDKVEAQLTG